MTATVASDAHNSFEERRCHTVCGRQQGEHSPGVTVARCVIANWFVGFYI